MDRSESAVTDGHRGHRQMFVLFQFWLEKRASSKFHRHFSVAHDTKMYVLRRTIAQFDLGRGINLFHAESDCALQRFAHVQQQTPAAEDTSVRLQD